MANDAKPEHSPTPWTARGNAIYCDSYGDPTYSDSWPIATTNKPSHVLDGISTKNAAHIVRCVNVHEALVEALELANAWFMARNMTKTALLETKILDALALTKP